MRANSPPKGEITLAQIAEHLHGLNPEHSLFHLQLFSYIIPDSSLFADFLLNLQLTERSFPNKHIAIVIIGNFSKIIPYQTSTVMAIGPDKELLLHTRVDSANLPECQYFAIVSAITKRQGGQNYSEARESIAFLRTLISHSFGKLPFYMPVATIDFDQSGTVFVASEAVQMPLFADLYRIIDTESFVELSHRLSQQQEQFRTRYQRAVDFYAMALDQNNSAFRFLSYWLALEILVGGKSDTIRITLAKAYGERKKEFANDRLLFKEIETIRHNLMHKGLFPGLLSYQERLLQL